MDPPPETGFPATLCRWVGEIVQSSPEAARLTLAELIVGAVLASGGHVTQAFLALMPRLGWQAYHWMLERFRLLGCAMPCVGRASSRASSSVVRVGEGLRLGQGA